MLKALIISCIFACSHGFQPYLKHIAHRGQFCALSMSQNMQNPFKSIWKQIVVILTLGALECTTALPVDFIHNVNAAVVPAPRKARRALAYSIEPTEPPCLIPRTTKGETSLVHRLAQAKILIVGKIMVVHVLAGMCCYTV